MAEFNSHIITNAGRNLLARALAGEGKVIFTKAAFGDQKHSGNLREVTELKNKKLDLNVMNIRNDNGTAVLTVQISNQNVDQSFQTEEFGVYAKIENDVSEVLYSYTTAVSADTFPNNRLGKTYESIQDIYMAISSDIEAEIYVRDGVIYLTRDIANQVYTETGVIAVGTLKGRSNLEENKQYLADNGHWYKNIGGNRSWNSLGTPDEQLIPITWEYLYKSLNIKEGQLIQNLNGLLGKNNGQFPVDQAVEGNVYYFPANQKYYYCLKSQSGRTSVPNADFEEMSIWANKKKLENLIRYEFIDKAKGTRYTDLQFEKIGNIGHVFLDIPSGVSNTLKEGTLLFNFPEKYRPKTFNLKIIVSYPSGMTARTRYDKNTGNVYILSEIKVTESMYLDTFYFLN